MTAAVTAMVRRRSRRALVLILVATVAAISLMTVVLIERASASTPPVHMTMACAHNSSGMLSYATDPSECSNNEHPVYFDEAEAVGLCVPSANAMIREIINPSSCPTQHRVYAPPATGQLFFCVMNSNGKMHWATGPQSCKNNEFLVYVEASNDPPVANDDAYGNVIGNVLRTVAEPADDCVLANDTDPDGGTLEAVPGTFATTLGGTVEMAADGCFTYNPPVGVTSANDTFDYTAIDSGGLTDSATVTMTITSELVWFVDAAFGGSSDGRLTNPFTSLTPLNDSPADVDDAGEYIFVYSGSYAGGLALEDDQSLIGQPNGLTISGQDIVAPYGSNPLIENVAGTALVLAANNTVRAIDASGLDGITGSAVGDLVVSGSSATGTAGAGVSLVSGALDVTLNGVSASGGLNGVVLADTTGAFIVTGDGLTAGSGGTIANTVLDVNVTDGIGIYLDNVSGVSLSYMQINDHPRFAVRGINVNGFALADSVIDGENGNNTFLAEGSVWLDDVHGVASITASTISGGHHDNVRIVNTTGVLALTVGDSAIADNGDTGGGTGFRIDTLGDANVTVAITGNTFEAHHTDHLHVRAAGSGLTDVTLSGNVFSGGHVGAIGQGVILLTSPSFSGAMDYDIQDNTITGTRSGGALHVNKGVSPSGTVSGVIANNTVGDLLEPGSGCFDFCSGIRIEAHGGGSHTVHILDNDIHQYEHSGIDLVAGEGAGTATLDATLHGNTLTTPGTFAVAGVYLNSGTTGADTNQVCADIGGAGALANVLGGSGGVFGMADVVLEQRFGTTVSLPGYAGGSMDLPAVEAFIAGQNTGIVTVFVDASGLGGGFTGGPSCSSP